MTLNSNGSGSFFPDIRSRDDMFSGNNRPIRFELTTFDVFRYIIIIKLRNSTPGSKPISPRSEQSPRHCHLIAACVPNLGYSALSTGWCTQTTRSKTNMRVSHGTKSWGKLSNLPGLAVRNTTPGDEGKHCLFACNWAQLFFEGCFHLKTNLYV